MKHAIKLLLISLSSGLAFVPAPRTPWVIRARLPARAAARMEASPLQKVFETAPDQDATVALTRVVAGVLMIHHGSEGGIGPANFGTPEVGAPPIPNPSSHLPITARPRARPHFARTFNIGPASGPARAVQRFRRVRPRAAPRLAAGRSRLARRVGGAARLRRVRRRHSRRARPAHAARRARARRDHGARCALPPRRRRAPGGSPRPPRATTPSISRAARERGRNDGTKERETARRDPRAAATSQPRRARIDRSFRAVAWVAAGLRDDEPAVTAARRRRQTKLDGRARRSATSRATRTTSRSRCCTSASSSASP